MEKNKTRKVAIIGSVKSPIGTAVAERLSSIGVHAGIVNIDPSTSRSEIDPMDLDIIEMSATSPEFLSLLREVGEVGHVIKKDPSAFSGEELREKLEDFKEAIKNLECRKPPSIAEELSQMSRLLPESGHPETRQERRKRIRQQDKKLKNKRK
jgi:hypothetical protein